MNRRVLAAAVGGVVVAGAVATGLALGSRPAAHTVASPPLVASRVESACGLSGTPGPGTAGASAATWTTVGAFALPVSATDGPGVRVQSGPWSCFTRTPSGAVLAGAVIPFRAESAAENWQDVVRAQTMPGVGQTAKLKAGLPAAELVTVRGYQIAGYSPDRATIRYYLHTPAIDASCATEVQWSGGDWRLVLGDDGSSSSGCTRGVPDQFTPWGPSGGG